MKKKNFINYCGLLGVAAFISYTAAVVFSPLAYPGYNWMAQAVSDLSGSDAHFVNSNRCIAQKRQKIEIILTKLFVCIKKG